MQTTSRSSYHSQAHFAYNLQQYEQPTAPLLSRSMDYIHAKVYGQQFDLAMLKAIINDIVSGQLVPEQIAAFLSACASHGLTKQEVADLTRAMLEAGNRIDWSQVLLAKRDGRGRGKRKSVLGSSINGGSGHKPVIVDKHCIGGLPGYRTTLIVVPIVAACGLVIPKISSRAITSSAGTADTMEVLAPVKLSMKKVQQVVEREHGCIVWGGVNALSPADDVFIHVERALHLGYVGQMVASVLSKKVAAGSTHVLIDIPIGPTAKIKSQQQAEELRELLSYVAQQMELQIKVVFTDGTKPIGRGVGPALEARDVLAVLQNQQGAPQDLRERALMLAGEILEFAPEVQRGTGRQLAEEALQSGRAWKKFQAICKAQGGMREPPRAAHTYVYTATRGGVVAAIDNQKLSLLAQLAGAPQNPAAGVYLQMNVGSQIEVGQPLFTIHAEVREKLDQAISFLQNRQNRDNTEIVRF
jgi:thymidine phosphorylase